MFKKRKRGTKKANKEVKSNLDDFKFMSNQVNDNLVQENKSKISAKSLMTPDENEEDEEDIMNLISKKKKGNKKPNKSGFKLKKLNFDHEEDSAPAFIPRKDKSMENLSAVTSVYLNKDESVQNDQDSAPKYTLSELQKLKQTQFETNKTASEYIQNLETQPDPQKSDSTSMPPPDSIETDFTSEEIQKMKKIKEIRNRKKLTESGVAMNTEKDEFLAPKDIQMAESQMDTLKEGIQDLYTINTDKNELLIEDIGDGESWIDNQLQNALGEGNHNLGEEMVMVDSQGDAEFVETPEMRVIKFAMQKEIDEYQEDLEYEVRKLSTAVKSDGAMVSSLEKGIKAHEEDLEKWNEVMGKTEGFRLLIEFCEIFEDLAGMLDQKEKEINGVYHNLKLWETQHLETIEDVKKKDETSQVPQGRNKSGLGFKAKPRIMHTAINSIQVLEKEHQKDIEAAQSTLKDVMAKVKEDYQTPEPLLSVIKQIYDGYSQGSFGFDFDILDIAETLIPYIKIHLIQNYTVSPSAGKITSLTSAEALRSFIYDPQNPYYAYTEDLKNSLGEGATEEKAKIDRLWLKVITNLIST